MMLRISHSDRRTRVRVMVESALASPRREESDSHCLLLLPGPRAAAPYNHIPPPPSSTSPLLLHSSPTPTDFPLICKNITTKAVFALRLAIPLRDYGFSTVMYVCLAGTLTLKLK